MLCYIIYYCIILYHSSYEYARLAYINAYLQMLCSMLCYYAIPIGTCNIKKNIYQ